VRRNILRRVDRGEIERHDFPTGRRGYDPASVDEHLRRVADEFERLGGRPPGARTLAGGTAEEVRLILEAAERGAGALMARAGEQASDHVERVRAAADGLLGKLDALDAELGGLLDGLRSSGERLARGLDELQAEAAAAAGRVPAAAPEEEDAPVEPSLDVGAEPSLDAEPLRDADEAGARLIALNMALGGSPREETARYLAEHYALQDPDALLDEVYSRAGR
jgi:DivIVA domain-containing protein